MSIPRTVFAFTLIALAIGCACAGPTPRCAEYEQSLSLVEADVSAVKQIGASASRIETPAVPISEEGAIFSKRLKTLCELLWRGHIPYGVYQDEAQRAYRDYHRTRMRIEVR